jgi:two-component system phosphate regulon sensor histidine kinase PhoR
LGNLTGEEANMFKVLVKNAQSVEEFLKTLRDLSRIGKSPLKIESFDLQEVFYSIRTTFFDDDDLERRNITLITPGESILIDADKHRLIRVFNNIFSNAFKYGGKRMSQIEVKCKDLGEYWLLSVSNNGKRLSEEDCEKIFSPNYRHKETSEGIDGTGRGLSIVRRISERHGGFSWAVPGKNRGMTFFVKILKTLPKKPE